jgi:hypothetical protein
MVNFAEANQLQFFNHLKSFDEKISTIFSQQEQSPAAIGRSQPLSWPDFFAAARSGQLNDWLRYYGVTDNEISVVQMRALFANNYHKLGVWRPLDDAEWENLKKPNVAPGVEENEFASRMPEFSFLSAARSTY